MELGTWEGSLGRKGGAVCSHSSWEVGQGSSVVRAWQCESPTDTGHLGKAETGL